MLGMVVCFLLRVIADVPPDEDPDEGTAEERDMENAHHHHMHHHLAGPSGPGMMFQWGCVGTGEWNGSCDISLDGKSIKQKADWSINCDPWKIGKSAQDNHPKITWSDAGDDEGEPPHQNWTCPEQHRSPSGCGDFRDDPRQLKCEEGNYSKHKGQWLFDRSSGYREERIVLTTGEPLLPQKHMCVQRPIFYENRNELDAVTPPMLGRHRERWPKWGEYEYLPTQRWLHAIEHGGFAFLYNHCLKPKDLCLIRRYIQKWKHRMEHGDLQNSRMRGSDRGAGKNEGPGEFRFVMTPFRHLQRAFAVMSWGEMYMSKGFNEATLDEFVEKNYRKAWEDFQTPGMYNYSWSDITKKDTSECSADVDIHSTKPLKMETVTQYEVPSDVSSIEIADLRAEQAALRQNFNTALVVGVGCYLATLVVSVVICMARRKPAYVLQSSADDA